jgi:hypothetical protein
MASRTFTYEALDRAGVLMKGKIESASAQAAAHSHAAEQTQQQHPRLARLDRGV